MNATQIDIAEAVGLDVSSVNKILNRKAGPKFRKETVARVFKAAKRLGYDFSKASKGTLVAILQELFPKDVPAATLAMKYGVPFVKVLEIREVIKRAGGAALVLLVLRAIIEI